MIVVIILCVLILSISLWLLLKKKKNKDKPKVELKRKTLEPVYISPSEFNAGSLVRKPQYISANNCDHNVLYPINAVNVFYGSKMPDNVQDCPCMQFIQAP